jgi:hypothetical protein
MSFGKYIRTDPSRLRPCRDGVETITKIRVRSKFERRDRRSGRRRPGLYRQLRNRRDRAAGGRSVTGTRKFSANGSLRASSSATSTGSLSVLGRLRCRLAALRAARLSQQALTMRGAGRVLLHEQVDEVRQCRQSRVLRVAQVTAVVRDCLRRVGLNRQQAGRGSRGSGLFPCRRRPSLARSRGCATRTPLRRPPARRPPSGRSSRRSEAP